MRTAFIYLLLTLLGLQSGPLSATTDSAPTFPESGFLTFTAALIEEQLESQKVERLQLTGPRRIVGDIIPGLSFKPGLQAGPFVCLVPHYPETHASLYAFSSAQFAPQINPETLNAYLAGKAIEASEESRFEIIEEAAQSSGPAKFRFLGGKAFTLSYDYDKVDQLQQRKRFRCTENWRLNKGIFYVFVVEAPLEGFERHYRLVAGSVNSMHFAE